MIKVGFTRQALEALQRGPGVSRQITEALERGARRARLLEQKTHHGLPKYMPVPREAYSAAITAPGEQEIGREIARRMSDVEAARFQEQLRKAETLAGQHPWATIPPAQIARKSYDPLAFGATRYSAMPPKTGAFDIGFSEELRRLSWL